MLVRSLNKFIWPLVNVSKNSWMSWKQCRPCDVWLRSTLFTQVFIFYYPLNEIAHQIAIQLKIKSLSTWAAWWKLYHSDNRLRYKDFDNPNTFCHGSRRYIVYKWRYNHLIRYIKSQINHFWNNTLLPFHLNVFICMYTFNLTTKGANS